MKQDPTHHALCVEVKRLDEKIGILQELRKEDRERVADDLEKAERALDKAHTALAGTLSGFPQEYAKRAELERLEDSFTALEVKTLPREIADQRQTELVERISTLEKWQANLIGRYLAISFIGAIITAVVVAVIVSLI